MVDSQVFTIEIEEANKVIEKIKQIANKDGVVTKREQSLLETIEEDLLRYKERLQQSIDNKTTTDLDVKKMKKFKQDIFDKARRLAAEDGKYVEEEWHILEQISDFSKRGL